VTVSVNEILSALQSTYSTIRFLEADDKTTGRYREKYVIVFEYTNIAGNRCVLKFFSLQHIEEGQQQREKEELLEEFRTIKRFGNTPYVVQAYDANELRLNGRLVGMYITMEKFDATLADLIKSNRVLKAPIVEDFLHQMDQILFMAHYQLPEPIVHSDIKPGNIGVRRLPDGKVQYALMDFDVSVVLRKGGDGSHELSNKASIRGITPAYAPPEQVMAYLHHSGSISNRVDIYAIGAIAMQMLTGLAPAKDTSKIYYQLPFHLVTGKWRVAFHHLCNPDPAKRPKRISEAFTMPVIEESADEPATIKIKSKIKSIPRSSLSDDIKSASDKFIVYLKSIHEKYNIAKISAIFVGILFIITIGLLMLQNWNRAPRAIASPEKMANQGVEDGILSGNSDAGLGLRSETDGTRPQSQNSVTLPTTPGETNVNSRGSTSDSNSNSSFDTAQNASPAPSTADISVLVSPSNANVVLRDSNGRVVARTTGNLNVLNIELGTYTLQATADGYIDKVEEIKIERPANTQRRVTLAQVAVNPADPTRDQQLITPQIDCGNAVRDVDGNSYSTVAIGQQCWMASNLRVSKYRDGSIIPRISNNTYWAGATTGAWVYYDNSASNDGVLYNWYAVSDQRGLCPVGWRVPAVNDWAQLLSILGDNVGGKLKSTRNWRTPNVGADNSSGFSALPIGSRTPNGDFVDSGSSTGFWTRNEASETTAPLRYLSYNLGTAMTFNQSKNAGYSVRCVK